MNRRNAQKLFDDGITYGQMHKLTAYVEDNCDLEKPSKVNSGCSKKRLLQIFINVYIDKGKETVLPRNERLGAVSLLREFGDYFEVANGSVDS